MTLAKRLSGLAIPVLVSAFLCGLGCSSSNNPSVIAGTGGRSNDATGGAPNDATGGSPNEATGGSPGAGGDDTSAGGSDTQATGGSATDSTTGGSTAVASTGQFSPVCGNTASSNTPIAKGIACTSADTQLCYKTCGPQSIGFKSETCAAGAYAEQSGCSFPTGVDYSCYKIPATIDASCPTTTPQASQACTVATCTPCNVNDSYLDSGGNSKQGLCVCTSSGKWSCASYTAWPCPAGQGC
jgi:hypothetical protein